MAAFAWLIATVMRFSPLGVPHAARSRGPRAGAGIPRRHGRDSSLHAIGSNTFIIVRIMEPFWFFAGIVLMLPQLERTELGPPTAVAPAPVAPRRLDPRLALRLGR